MKENVFDVLMYLFENYMDDDPEISQDQETLSSELAQAGFRKGEISKAFTWLEGLSNLRQQDAAWPQQRVVGSLRHYSEREKVKLSLECRGFLMSMEHSGVLEPNTREMVIDRVMALDAEEIELEHLKWIILLILFNQPGQEQAYSIVEDMVFDYSPRSLH
jgi:Smg protein